MQFRTKQGEGARVYNKAVNFKRTEVHRGLDFDKGVTTFIKLQEADTITMGCSHQLICDVSSPINNATVTWKSSDPLVLEVDEEGVIYGKNTGKAVVTATCEGASVSCTVPVGILFEDEKFKQYMLSNFDFNNDGVVTGDEALAVESIDCTNLGIKSLRGIEYCTKLTSLVCGNNNLGHLDVSCFPDLTLLDCPSCGLSELFFGSLNKLVTLYVQSNQLTEIDLSKMSNLVTFYAHHNKLQELGPIPSEVLGGVILTDNKLSGVIDLSKSPYLHTVFINGATSQYDDNNVNTLYIHSSYKYNKTTTATQYYNSGPSRTFNKYHYKNNNTKLEINVWTGSSMSVVLKGTE